MGIQGWQLVVILVIILLLFGAPKLPKLAKSIGESARIFKSEVKTMREDDSAENQRSEQQSSQQDPPPVSGRVIDGNAPSYQTHSPSTGTKNNRSAQ